MTTFAVYTTATGVLRSIGDTVASPLPAGLTSVALSDPDALSLANGTGRWDTATHAVVAVVPTVQETNESDLLTKANNALSANGTFLAIGASPTNVQVRDHVITLTKENTGIIKLLLARVFGQTDKLDTTTGT